MFGCHLVDTHTQRTDQQTKSKSTHYFNLTRFSNRKAMHPTKDQEAFDKADLMDMGLVTRPNELRSPKNSDLSDMFGSINMNGENGNGGLLSHGRIHNEEDVDYDDHDGNRLVKNDDGKQAEDGEDDDDDDIDQLNIDEVDQVRGEVLDNNLAVDEEFQHSLNERASQFASGSEANSINTTSFPSIPKPKVDYNYNDDFILHSEVNNWFTSHELKKLPIFKKVFQTVTPIPNFVSLREKEQSKAIEILLNEVAHIDESMDALYCLVYISLGTYGNHSDYDQHASSIKHNNYLLAKNNAIPKLIYMIQKGFKEAKNPRGRASYYSNVLFYSLTILYFIVCSDLDLDERKDFTIEKQLDQQDILVLLIKFIDEWRWNSLPSLRIRNIITLFAKTFQLLIGDYETRNKTKNYLCEKLGIVKEDNPSKLTTTPLDYYVFREDLLARYPTSIPPPSTLPSDFENSSSLSQFINIPRTLETSKANTSLPVPSVHIATPAPSPPSTPVTKTNKIKRSYQTNQSYPFIYPTTTLDHNGDSETFGVPTSIKEATELCSSRVQEKLSLKQLWSERDNFMQQERGWTDALNASDQEFDDYSELNTELTPELTSLTRVEHFYSKSVPYLSSLVHVLLQVAISSQENNQLYADENKDWTNETELDIVRAKELALKNASYILVLTLKWLKVSHVLKFEYLSTLIYDSNYFAIMIQYLKSVGESIYQRITFTTFAEDTTNFWSQCSTLSPSPYSVPKTNITIDETFCFNLISLLTIGALTCHKKTQRIISLSEKDPARLFKPFFLLINNSLWKPILKMVKEITPFNGRKWKSYNMDLISMVYLHMKPQLRENWLSGRDLDGELKDAYGQEIALRAIIQFYNLRRYSDSMNELGYEKREGDFFTREMELFAVSDV